MKSWKKKEENGKCKVKNDWIKLRTFFFPFLLLRNHWNFFWIYQNGKFRRKKAKITPGKSGKVTSRREKIGKSDFAPPEKFPCYATDLPFTLRVKQNS